MPTDTQREPTEAENDVVGEEVMFLIGQYADKREDRARYDLNNRDDLDRTWNALVIAIAKRVREAEARWKHVTEQAYLATSDDGALLLTVYLADDTNVPFLTRRERAQLAGDAEPFGVVRGAEAITRAVDADRAAVEQWKAEEAPHA